MSPKPNFEQFSDCFRLIFPFLGEEPHFPISGRRPETSFLAGGQGRNIGRPSYFTGGLGKYGNFWGGTSALLSMKNLQSELGKWPGNFWEVLGDSPSSLLCLTRSATYENCLQLSEHYILNANSLSKARQCRRTGVSTSIQGMQTQQLVLILVDVSDTIVDKKETCMTVMTDSS